MAERVFPFVVILALFAVPALIGLRVRRSYKDRVNRHITDRGGRLLSIRWAPFGPEWFDHRVGVIYHIVYDDADGNRHDAYAKTGVMEFTRDTVVRRGEPRPARSRRPS